MSEFTKKAENKGPRIYRVRDFLELYKNGEADIKIHSVGLNGEEFWDMCIPWNYGESKYYTDRVPNNIKDLIVLRHQVLNGPAIHLYV
jgi:hypothetical protein